MSKYQEVVEDIIHKIENDEYTDKLPTEDQLIEQYQVSRNTIRNAIRTLKKQGTLFSIQGSGVFVRHTRDDDSLWMNGSCGITENAPRHKITTDVKGFHIMMAGEELSKRMQCELTTPIYYIERVRKMMVYQWLLSTHTTIRILYLHLIVVLQVSQSIVILRMI